MSHPVVRFVNSLCGMRGPYYSVSEILLYSGIEVMLWGNVSLSLVEVQAIITVSTGEVRSL